VIAIFFRRGVTCDNITLHDLNRLDGSDFIGIISPLKAHGV
jgi:hypothetical protein